MIEVFYEQLNYEILTESEAYGVSEWCSENDELSITLHSTPTPQLHPH